MASWRHPWECPAWLGEELGTFSSPGILLHHGDFGSSLVWAIPWICGQDCSLFPIPREAHSPHASRPCEVLRTKILHSAPQQIILSHQECSFHPSQPIPAAAAASPRLAREGDCGEILGNPVSSAGRRSLRAPCEIKLCAHICKCLGQRLSRAGLREEVAAFSNADQMAPEPPAIHGQIPGYPGL